MTFSSLPRKRDRARLIRPIGSPPWADRVVAAPSKRRRIGRRAEPRRRDDEYVSLPDYRAFLAADICGVADELGHTRDCHGPIDPEHERSAAVGMGQRAGDDRCWGCCRRHHGERHALNGYFKGWGRARLSRFIYHRINVSWARYTRHRGLTV